MSYQYSCLSTDNDDQIWLHIYHRPSSALIWLADESDMCCRTDLMSMSVSQLDLGLSVSKNNKHSQNWKKCSPIFSRYNEPEWSGKYNYSVSFELERSEPLLIDGHGSLTCNFCSLLDLIKPGSTFQAM